MMTSGWFMTPDASSIWAAFFWRFFVLRLAFGTSNASARKRLSDEIFAAYDAAERMRFRRVAQF